MAEGVGLCDYLEKVERSRQRYYDNLKRKEKSNMSINKDRTNQTKKSYSEFNSKGIKFSEQIKNKKLGEWIK